MVKFCEIQRQMLLADMVRRAVIRRNLEANEPVCFTNPRRPNFLVWREFLFSSEGDVGAAGREPGRGAHDQIHALCQGRGRAGLVPHPRHALCGFATGLSIRRGIRFFMSQTSAEKLDALLAQLKELRPKPEGLNLTTEARQNHVLAEIHVEVAKVQARAADKLERQTKTLINLTWAIVFLTFVLLVFTILLYRDAHL